MTSRRTHPGRPSGSKNSTIDGAGPSEARHHRPLSPRERAGVRGQVELKELARDLRQNQTDAERVLWQRLRGRRLLGCKFRRQYPMAPFIVDFVCLERHLVIELDGGQHAQQSDYDSKRTRALEARGFRVLRLWNNEVLTEMDGVLEVVARWL